ncbi:MAG: CidA/LrgA family protein [Oscillospiraceae bacterium]|nr:CidA/LrgA family protein [Oscillospiraceae bacterium]
MKYIKQGGIILGVSFVGEILHFLIPLPIPAGIYGIILMFLCLQTRLIPLAEVETTADFLVEMMPIMFVPAAVGVMEALGLLGSLWLAYLLVTVVSTLLVMLCSGWVTQGLIRLTRKRKEGKKDD